MSNKYEPADCRGCGEEIPEARVKARPGTTLCVDCQQKREDKGQFQRHVIDVQPVIEAWENVGITQTLVRGSD